MLVPILGRVEDRGAELDEGGIQAQQFVLEAKSVPSRDFTAAGELLISRNECARPDDMTEQHGHELSPAGEAAGLAIHAALDYGSFKLGVGQGGDFECLALAPASPSGSADSGVSTMNVMYVTGKVTSLEVNGNTVILSGTATVNRLRRRHRPAFSGPSGRWRTGDNDSTAGFRSHIS